MSHAAMKQIEATATGNQPEPVEPPLSTPAPPGIPLYMVDLGTRILQRVDHQIRRHERIYTGVHGVKGKRVSRSELSRRTGIPRTTINRYLDGTYQLNIDVLDKIMHALGWTLADILTPSEYHNILGCEKPRPPQRPPVKKTLRRGWSRKNKSTPAIDLSADRAQNQNCAAAIEE